MPADDPGDNSNDVQGESTPVVALLCSSHGRPAIRESDNNVDALLVRARAQYSDLAARKPDYFVVGDAAKSPSRIRQRPGHNGRQLILYENQRTVATLERYVFGPRHAVDQLLTLCLPLSVVSGMNGRRWRCSAPAAYSSPECETQMPRGDLRVSPVTRGIEPSGLPSCGNG